MTLRLGIGALPSLGRVVTPDMDDALGACLKARSLQMKPKTAGVGRLGGAGLCVCRWLWMKTHCKLGGLQTNHIPLQYAMCSHGVASAEDSIIVSRIWCQYFKNNPEFWDDGINNLPLSIPRSEPESIQEIYPESGALTPDRKAAFDRRSGVGLRSGRKLRGGFGTGNAVEAESDERSWIASMLQYTKSGQGRQALRVYEEMQRSEMILSSHVFVAALKACGSIRDLASARRIHAEVVINGLESILFVGNTLVDVYAKCGSLSEARRVFDMMPRRSVVSWNAMILGYAQMGHSEEALQLYGRMQQESVDMNCLTFLGALKACSALIAKEEGNIGHGTQVKRRCLEQVTAIHLQVVEGGCESDVYVGAKLVDVYAKCGSLVDARAIFEKMSYRDVVTWNAMIFGYAQMEQGEEALQLYTKMEGEGVPPNCRTFVGALQACGSLAGLEKGKEIHSQVVSAGLRTTDPYLASSLIDMYAKCGSMADAQKLFDALPTPDIVTSSALIAGYARLGESEIVFELFERMVQEGIQPNGITFLSVMTACSHAGLVAEGQTYFDAMTGHYGLQPSVEHYNCMVDLLGRAGEVVKAMQLVRSMPFEPPGKVWRCLLGACRKWGNVEIGREAFERALRLDQNDASAYVLMSNIYSGARMRDEAKKIHAMRLGAGAWKQPGISRWTDTAGTVHAFAVRARGHPEGPEIRAKIKDLVLKMKRSGYVPHLDSVLKDVPDDEKEDALCEHSEKLAIAYALLKTPEGTTIRVVKNLRVCEDCHTAIAFISKLEQRTIICRDMSRFHVYRDGVCSCMNYW